MEEIDQLLDTCIFTSKKQSSPMAVVFWIREKKISKEPVTNIKVEADRKEGLTTQVRFGRGKTCYPAKILKISDKEEELEDFFKECLQKMEFRSSKEGKNKEPSQKLKSKGVNEKKKTAAAKIRAQREVAARAIKSLEESGGEDQVTEEVPQRVETENNKISLPCPAIPADMACPESHHEQDQQPLGTGIRYREAMDTVLWPEQSSYGSLFRPVPLYPESTCHRTSYAALHTESEEVALLKEEVNRVKTQLLEERSIHVKEMMKVKMEHEEQMFEMIKRHNEDTAKLRDSKALNLSDGSMEFSPGKVTFLENLTSTMRKSFEPMLSKSQSSLPPLMRPQKKLCLDPVAPVPENDIPEVVFEYTEKAGPSFSASLAETLASPDIQLPAANTSLQSPSSAIPLVEDIEDVLITKEQRSSCLLRADGKPELLVRELLSVYFSQQELAGGCALGLRPAHNRSSTTTPLSGKILNAIKRFVLLKFRQDTGQPVLKDKDFNYIINSKCATARRALARLYCKA